jgi:multidrug efflux system membrane fusion protein
VSDKIKQYITRYSTMAKMSYRKVVNYHPWAKKVVWILLILLAVKITMSLYGHYKKSKKSAVLTVQVSQVRKQSMPVLIKSPGSISAINSVSITPQITGIIKNIAFEAGDYVEKGQLLFEIEQAPFLESLRQAKATLSRDESTLIQNKADAKRYDELAKKEYVTRQQAEQTATTVLAQTAIVEASRALVQQAEIQLDYTIIQAPMNGKTGDFTVNQGDLVVANSQTPLVVINQSNLLWVSFNLAQSYLPSILRYQQEAPLTVNVFPDHDETTLLGTGELVLIDNAINTQTGTVLLKGKIKNPDNKLWPGMMVNVELVLTIEPNAIVVPGNAIQFDQTGNFVYCVENGKARVKRVVVSRQIKGLAVITTGLTGDETVITTIAPDLVDGSVVAISGNGA